jgi:hypothetical protein
METTTQYFDAIGQELQVGDYVCYARKESYGSTHQNFGLVTGLKLDKIQLRTLDSISSKIPSETRTWVRTECVVKVPTSSVPESFKSVYKVT